jgi:hypothetical protein
MRAKGKPEHRFDASFGTILELVSIFKEATETLY